MAKLLLDRETMILSPHRSRQHPNDLVQLGVADGYGIFDDEDHVVPASVWRFDRPVDPTEEIPSGEALIMPPPMLRKGLNHATARCTRIGFILAESCYPGRPDRPITDFRIRTTSLRIQTDQATLRLGIKPHYMPDMMAITPTALDGTSNDWLQSPSVTTIVLPPEEWTTFIVNRYDQSLTGCVRSGRSFDIAEDGTMYASKSSSRYVRVRRGIL